MPTGDAAAGVSVADLRSAMDDDEIVELAKQLVAIPSYTTEESELADFIADYLSANAVEATLQRVPLPAGMRSGARKSYKVIGRVRGAGGCGH